MRRLCGGGRRATLVLTALVGALAGCGYNPALIGTRCAASGASCPDGLVCIEGHCRQPDGGAGDLAVDRTGSGGAGGTSIDGGGGATPDATGPDGGGGDVPDDIPTGACTSGDTEPCGPATVGVCQQGTRTCVNSAWGACQGAVGARPRDCTSPADNDCDGKPDNTVDGTCACSSATGTRSCDTHPQDGTGSCQAGTQACVLGANKSSSSWGPCAGGVGPVAADRCDKKGDDSNCNGTANDNCPCVTNDTQPCGPAANRGICVRGTQTCVNGQWGACMGAVNAMPRDCTSSSDNDCDGKPDNTLDAVCVCNSASSTQACGGHPQDGKGPCHAGSQTCVLATNKTSSTWGACTGAVGPAGADSCDSGNDANCNGVPNDNCVCVNGASGTCGSKLGAKGTCAGGSTTCANGAWGACTITAKPADSCTPGNDDNCDGTGSAGCGCAFKMPNPVATGLPNPASYTDNGTTVTDNVTKIVWEKSPSPTAAQCTGSSTATANFSAITCTQADAAKYCASKGAGWRLPTRLEMVSLADFTTGNFMPRMNTTYFPGTPSDNFWTSTPVAGTPSDGWFLAFQGEQGTTSVTGTYRVRCARDGATPVCGPGRFHVMAGGVVQDAGTGLFWQQTVDARSHSFTDGKTYCPTLGAGWRVPSLNELSTLLDDTATTATLIDATAFPGAPSDAYWSSTADVSDSSKGWYIFFGNGFANSAIGGLQFYVRCVR